MAASSFSPILNGSQNLIVGSRAANYFKMDEFRVSLRAASAAEILAWSSVESAAHAPFETACHPFGRAVGLDGRTGGLPKIGNVNYALSVYGLPQSVVALGLGSNNQSFSGLGLPLDLKIFDPRLSSCYFRTSAELFRFGTIGPTGVLSFPLPIPNLPGASGATLYSQAVLDSSTLKTTMLTNAYAIVVGK